MDSTPDISHVDQITFIVRVIDCSTNIPVINELFLGFFPLVDMTGEGLFNFLIQQLLPMFQLDIKNMRGQGYDNESNMKGKRIGLQKRIKNINPRAFYVPCAALTLNLVVNDAAKITHETLSFFDVVQEIYIFFSSSPYRWQVLKDHVPKLTLESLSDGTRWESRIQAIRPLRSQFASVHTSLESLVKDETRDAKNKAYGTLVIGQNK